MSADNVVGPLDFQLPVGFELPTVEKLGVERPAAISIPGNLKFPETSYIRGPSYQVTFDTIERNDGPPQNNDADMRRLASDNAIKDMMVEEDRKFFAALEALAPKEGKELEKKAADAINDFTRTRMRESEFFSKIMPPLPINNDDLTPEYEKGPFPGIPCVEPSGRIEFRAYQEVGATIGNVAGLARVDFD